MTSDSADPETLALALIQAATRAGAQQSDAIVLRGQAVSIDVRKGGLELAERAEATEIGLRVLIGGRQASVSASDHAQATIEEMAARAVAMAREAPVDDTLGLADPDQLARNTDAAAALEMSDPGADPAPDHLQSLALRAEAAAAAMPGISQVESAAASFSRRQIWLAASNGFSGGYHRSSHAISTVAITGEGLGMERDYAGESRIWAADLPQPEQIGQLAAQRTMARAGSRKPPTGAFPILYDRRVSPTLIGHLLGAVNGSAIARGASWLRNALNEAVLPADFTLTEDPLRPRYGGSRPFDAEGLPCHPRDIVAQGVLTGWTLDLATGRKLGMASTGSATRGLTSAPSPGNSNVVLTPGQASFDDLLAEMERGLVVTSMLGASVNATTGDYSRGAAGFWVEGGKIAYPVNECTIAGNLRDMLMTLTAANDAEDWRTIQVPSLLVRGMTVAGA
ncbi:TldD/PmbA family protein [Paracoccus sp. M683]|uniref:TldD/PmbA family protein n=1 Tax=Paracoccus sp. M683 TaxID=2594268 RepID=UPI0011816DCF|nr:metallopeptidase TldD-related protein [Paracoccus sp. M683]TRW98802.1 TldD/PmbA family protein [Paracoccus sp. M683]